MQLQQEWPQRTYRERALPVQPLQLQQNIRQRCLRLHLPHRQEVQLLGGELAATPDSQHLRHMHMQVGAHELALQQLRVEAPTAQPVQVRGRWQRQCALVPALLLGRRGGPSALQRGTTRDEHSDPATPLQTHMRR